MIRFLQSGNKAAKYILGGFLIILAASMVTYLIPGFMSGDNTGVRTGVVANVAGTKIQIDEVNKLVQAQAQGRQIPDFYLPILQQQAVRQLIQKQEVRYEAERLGLKVSDSEVRDEMEHGPYKVYFFPDGKWIGQQQYEKFLGDNGIAPAVFEAELRDNLLGRKLFNTIAAGVSVSPADVEHAFKNQNTKIKFQYATLDREEIARQLKPSEAELRAYYMANTARYQNTIPEKRQVRYFIISDKDAEAKVTVEPGELQRYYTANQDAFRLQDRVRVRHILVKTPPLTSDGKPDAKGVDAARAKAADIVKQIKGGADFAELAKKESADPGSADKGGELGWIVKGQTVAEFEKKSFEQNPGQISEPVQTQFGFHIIQTEEKEVARLKPFSEVKDDIEKIVRSQKAGAYLDQTLRSVGETAQKQGLDKAAAQRGAPIIQSNPVARSEALPGIGPSPETMSAIFSSPEKSAQVARFAQGYVVFDVSKIEPARTPSFEEIREKVATDFKNERSRELLQRKLAALADRAHAEHDLAKAAKEAGATMKTSELVGRTSQVPEIGAMTGQAGALFDLKQGEISGPIALANKGAVAQILERQEPSTGDPQFAQQRETLAEQLTNQKREQALELFMTELEKRLKNEGKIKIYESELKSPIRSRS